MKLKSIAREQEVVVIFHYISYSHHNWHIKLVLFTLVDKESFLLTFYSHRTFLTHFPKTNALIYSLCTADCWLSRCFLFPSKTTVDHNEKTD